MKEIETNVCNRTNVIGEALDEKLRRRAQSELTFHNGVKDAYKVFNDWVSGPCSNIALAELIVGKRRLIIDPMTGHVVPITVAYNMMGEDKYAAFLERLTDTIEYGCVQLTEAANELESFVKDTRIHFINVEELTPFEYNALLMAYISKMFDDGERDLVNDLYRTEVAEMPDVVNEIYYLITAMTTAKKMVAKYKQIMEFIKFVDHAGIHNEVMNNSVVLDTVLEVSLGDARRSARRALNMFNDLSLDHLDNGCELFKNILKYRKDKLGSNKLPRAPRTK